MAIARLYIDGQNFEIMGNVVDKFSAYNNTLEASRSGKIYATTESTVRIVKVDDVKLDISEFDEIRSFFSTCGSKRFNVTVSINEDCASAVAGEDGYIEHHYINCIIQGEPEFSIFERKISNFEFGYESCIIRKPS